MIYTTLNKIREHSPCEYGWKRLLAYLGKTKADDEPLAMLTVLKSNGLDDTLWCCRTLPEYNREWRLFAVWCIRNVEHLMTDQRSRTAINVAERFANGEASEKELDAAWDAAQDAAPDAAQAAAWDAALDAAWAARNAAWVTAWDAAWDAAWATARREQEAEFCRIISSTN